MPVPHIYFEQGDQEWSVSYQGRISSDQCAEDHPNHLVALFGFIAWLLNSRHDDIHPRRLTSLRRFIGRRLATPPDHYSTF